MSSEFWAKKIGSIATPRPQAPPQQAGAWWQDAPPPQAPGYPAPALHAQMPGQQPQYTHQATGQVVNEQYVRQLLRVPAEDLTQEQMELIAEWELATKDKYNQVCPQCSSSNFVPAGTRIGTTRMGTDKCFECGASSSTFTASPEPALGGGRGGSAAYRDIRQIDTGGGAGGMYLKFNGLPGNYVPRG